jgi:hypothetical protein
VNFSRTLRSALLVSVAAAALTACSAPADELANTVAGQLPDLTPQGLTSFECGSGDAIGGSFQEPNEPYVAECWQGSPAGKTFLDVANSTQDAVIQATGGTDVTADACPEDSLSSAGGIACRAALVTKGTETILVRTVVVLADPSTALAGLPQDPTQDQINEQISGAAVEVLVGTQSPTASPQPTNSN